MRAYPKNQSSLLVWSAALWREVGRDAQDQFVTPREAQNHEKARRQWQESEKLISCD